MSPVSRHGPPRPAGNSLSSFQRKLEPSVSETPERRWVPAFAGMAAGSPTPSDGDNRLSLPTTHSSLLVPVHDA